MSGRCERKRTEDGAEKEGLRGKVGQERAGGMRSGGEQIKKVEALHSQLRKMDAKTLDTAQAVNAKKRLRIVRR